MQPPPRKGNYAKFLKNLHSEQINKLVLKNQHECDLLEDIRTFTLKRSSIEKSYSEALLKISSAYLNKKIPNIPDIKLDGGEEKWNMWNVWRTVLEENEKLARARLAAVEVFQQQIADDAKLLRAHKVQMAKRCIDQLAIVQKELQTTVQDVDKTKKFYFDEEHSAHDVRDKARDIEEKLKKKKGSFFQSITSLQKNSQKFSTKRDQLEEKSTGARNDYLLCLASANAHQTRYFLVDLQQCMTIMESGVYEKVAEYLSLMGRTELLTCSAMLNSYGTIRDQANQLTREYNLQCCYLYYPVLKQHIQYEFEPCDNDPVDTVTADHDSSAAVLSKEARRWATRIARENCNVREGTRKLQTLIALRDSGQKVDPTDPNGPDIETKIEEFRQSVRRAETAKAKAEARIECLRAGGVNVDEWLQEAETLTVQDIQRSTSSLSDHPSSDSFYDSDFADGEPQAPPSTEHQPSLPSAERKDSDAEGSQPDHFSEPSIEVDVMLEQERQRIEQLTCGWDDPTQVDWGNEDAAVNSAANVSPAPSGGTLLKCMALYTYTAQNPDELSIVENEQLEVVGEGDGDGWLRARNYKGEEGYVPHNYLEVERAETATTPAGLTAQISFSSVDYTIDNEDNEPFQQSQSETANQSPEQDSVIATSVPKQIPEPLPASYCVALYDYEGEGEEDELTLEEGQIIRIVSRNAHDMDDGWWRGELEGRVGNFPSLVVEECDEYGEPISINLEETPPPSAPPVFTPPDAPADLPPDLSGDLGFCMNLSRGQRQQYGSQFQFQEDDDMPSIDIPTVEIDDENGEKVCKDTDKEGDDYGLGVAQIVITAATPMIEDPDRSFPPPENHVEESASQSGTREDPEGATSNEDQPPSIPHSKKHPVSVSEGAAEGTANDDDEDRSAGDEQGHGGGDTTPFPVSSSTGSEGETTGPSTAENSITQAPLSSTDEPKQLIGGRASIPDELEPHQLARLQDLKESNA